MFHTSVCAKLHTLLTIVFCLIAVHEKSILLPLLPASLLALHHGSLIAWLAPVAAFSMFDLLKRDGLVVAYIALQGLYLLFASPPENDAGGVRKAYSVGKWPSLQPYVAALFGVTALLLHAASFLVIPPRRFPYLHAALHVSSAFCVFFTLFIVSNVLQWRTEQVKTKLE